MNIYVPLSAYVILKRLPDTLDKGLGTHVKDAVNSSRLWSIGKSMIALVVL